jgi:hypothetical protein
MSLVWRCAAVSGASKPHNVDMADCGLMPPQPSAQGGGFLYLFRDLVKHFPQATIQGWRFQDNLQTVEQSKGVHLDIVHLDVAFFN